MTKRLPRRLVLPAITLALLAGCQSLPRNEAPPLPSEWHARDAAAPLRVPSEQAWWQGFGDPSLSRFIDAALARNTDLASAAWRIRNAQLRAGAATQALFPTPNGSMGGGSARAAPQAGQPVPSWQHSTHASLGVGWELDLWGRIRDQRTAAVWEAQATADDRDAVALSLTGNVARQYWQIAALQARIERADDSLATAQRTLELTRVQYRAGAISGLDLAQAEQSLQTQQAARVQLQQQWDDARNAFSLLFDLPPPQLPEGRQVDTVQALSAQVPDIPAGVPADVLTRRPDLRAAQQRLEATLLNIRITRKQFLPGVSLTGNLGSGGTQLKDILSAPSQSLGIGISLPFLNVPEMIRAPKIAANDYEIAVLGYRQSVYRALSEVESALSGLQAQRRQVTLQQEALERARRIERMNEVRYRAGANPLRLWLDAQEARRQAELALIDARFNALQAAANLHLALGGSLR